MARSWYEKIQGLKYWLGTSIGMSTLAMVIGLEFEYIDNRHIGNTCNGVILKKERKGGKCNIYRL